MLLYEELATHLAILTLGTGMTMSWLHTLRMKDRGRVYARMDTLHWKGMNASKVLSCQLLLSEVLVVNLTSVLRVSKVDRHMRVAHSTLMVVMHVESRTCVHNSVLLLLHLMAVYLLW